MFICFLKCSESQLTFLKLSLKGSWIQSSTTLMHKLQNVDVVIACSEQYPKENINLILMKWALDQQDKWEKLKEENLHRDATNHELPKKQCIKKYKSTLTCLKLCNSAVILFLRSLLRASLQGARHLQLSFMSVKTQGKCHDLMLGQERIRIPSKEIMIMYLVSQMAFINTASSICNWGGRGLCCCCQFFF